MGSVQLSECLPTNKMYQHVPRHSDFTKLWCVCGFIWVSSFKTSFIFSLNIVLEFYCLVLFRLTMSTFRFYVVLVSQAILVSVFVDINDNFSFSFRQRKQH